MHVCTVLSQVWKSKSKSVFGVLSILLLILVLPRMVDARDYHIQASDGETYTITVGEEVDVENFSISRLDGQLVTGVTLDERAIASELYDAARILTFLRKNYSPERPFEDYMEWVRVIGDDAFDKLGMRQLAAIVGSFSVDILKAIATGGSSTAVELSVDIIGEINGAIADELERRLVLDAQVAALTTASNAIHHENILRGYWSSYETRSIAIPIEELYSALENFYKAGEYLILTNELVVTYLGVPGFKERMLDFFKGLIPSPLKFDTLISIQSGLTHF